MSLPPDGTAPQIEPELASKESEAMEVNADEEFEMEKALQFCRLNDRRVMETKQELDRIEQMGKVHKLLHQHIAAKIGRNLEAKFLNYGPLGKDKDSDLTSPLTSPKQIPPPPPIRLHIDGSSSGGSSKRNTSSHRRMPLKTKMSTKTWVVGRQNFGGLNSSFEESQKKELEDIKDMQIVKNRLANRRRARSLANRMFNARVNNSRTKTSILLTGSEPDQEEMVEAMRHMNRFVIEKFLQTQSRNRRVLDRLNSIQMKTISSIEVGKAHTRKQEQMRRRSDSSIHEAMIVEEAEEREREEERKGVKRPYKHASLSSFSSLLDRTGSALKAKFEHGLKKVTHHSSPKRRSLTSSSPRATTYRKKKKGNKRLRRNRAEREKICSYADEEETFSKSSGTDEVDTASPMYSGLTTLEPLFEKAALFTPAVKDQESTESDKTISPMSSSGGVFLPPSSGPPPVFTSRSSRDHDTLSDQAVPISTASMAASPPQSPSTQLLTGSVSPPTSATPLERATPTKPAASISLQSKSVKVPTIAPQAPPLSQQEHHHQTKEALPIVKSAPSPPPPPFQAHGLPTTLSITSTRPSNAQTDSPGMEIVLDTVTSAGYQADTEFQFEELSQEHVTGFFKPFPPQTQVSNVSSEESMQEMPIKRARIEEESDDNKSVEFDDLQVIPVLQSQYRVEEAPKIHSVIVAEDRYSHSREEAQVVPMLVDADGVQVVRVNDAMLDNECTKDVAGHKNKRPIMYNQNDMSERGEAGEKERRPVISTRRVVHEEASTDLQEDEEMEVVKEKGSSSNYQKISKAPSRKSSSLENRQGSSDSGPQTPPRVKRHFSTPTVSMDIENWPQIRPSFKPKPGANRAYYTPIEVDEEFNPFNYEFEQDSALPLRSPEVVPKSRGGGGRIDSDSAGVPLRQRSPRVKPRRYDSSHSPRASPGQPCRTAEVKQKAIPPSAFDNPSFRQYIRNLSHPPTYDDYLSFRVVHRLVVIGDDIEVRYKDKINNALDNIYMDIMKKTFCFEKFSAIANRLLLESKQMQDRVFMIPLLARRLKEEVTPQLASAVGNYTEMFMDHFVIKYLMSMGGWENVVESYEDIEVHDEHPSYYGDEAGINVGFDDQEELMNGYMHHQHEGGASNYDHLYDGGGGIHFDNHVRPPPFQNHGLNMNEIDRVPYLDTYKDEWPAPGKEAARTRTPTKEEIFLSYLAFHHPFLAEDPDYLRRVNSVEVLFQESTDPSDNTPDISCNDIDGNSTNHKPRRKRSSQISLARSLSADSLASPGLGSGAFCISPTASTTFLSRRISHSASRNPAPPADSPTKRAFPRPHSPIIEHVDYPIVLDPPQSGIFSVVPKGGINFDDSQSHIKPPPLTSLVSNPAPSTEPHPVSLPPQPPVDVPSPQVSVSPPSSSPSMPPYQGQSSGETYEHLYDSDPSRSNSGNSNTGSHASNLNPGNKKSNGVQHQTKTDGKYKEPQPDAAQVSTPKWVVPVAIVTVGVALIAGYYYFRRRS